MKWFFLVGLLLSVVDIGHLIERDLAGTHVLGIMPGVEVKTTPNTLVCGKWIGAYSQPVVSSPYCRTTGEDGSTFFRYRARFSGHHHTGSFVMPDISAWDIQFQVTN